MPTLVFAEALWKIVQLEGCVTRESRAQGNIRKCLNSIYI